MVHLEPSDLEAAKAEIRRLQREANELQKERDILKSSEHFLPQKDMKYEFMAAHQNEYRIGRMCQVLGVSRSGYYAWQARGVSARERANRALLAKIYSLHAASRQTYGSPRIHAALRQQGVLCSRKRVAHLIQVHRLTGRISRRRRPPTTQRNPAAIPAPNHLNREFAAPAPNRKWAADLTFIATAEGGLYLACVLDLYSRAVVGWAMADRMDVAMVQG